MILDTCLMRVEGVCLCLFFFGLSPDDVSDDTLSTCFLPSLVIPPQFLLTLRILLVTGTRDLSPCNVTYTLTLITIATHYRYHQQVLSLISAYRDLLHPFSVSYKLLTHTTPHHPSSSVSIHASFKQIEWSQLTLCVG